MYEGGELEPEIVSTTFKGEDMWQKWTEEEREARKQELLALAQEYTPTTNRVGDQYRHEDASSSAGFDLKDSSHTSLLRNSTLEMVGVSHQYSPLFSVSDCRFYTLCRVLEERF